VKSYSIAKISGGLAAVAILSLSMVAGTGLAATAAEQTPPVAAAFPAPLCAGTTDSNPAENDGYAVPDLTQVFDQRLVSYNAGSIVPLYDAFGGSILLTSSGENTGQAAYPPVCGTRYVASIDAAVSEWMFCTDRSAQACGDTDADGNLVDHDGNPIAPMTGLPKNPKLDANQEKLIAYLVQHGHSYAGVGDQGWDGVTEARSDLGSNERLALQTLVWCISDPSDQGTDFDITCENNLDEVEQQRLLAMIPDAPELVLSFSSGAALNVGQTATFTLTTNVFNQPIQIETAGTATTSWSVCSGDATLTDSTLTVAGSNPAESEQIVLCAKASTVGTATVNASAAPPSTEHIGWSQSINPTLEEPCQVFATFHEDNKATISASASTTFGAGSAPTHTATATTAATLANTGGSDLSLLWLGLGLAGIGGIAITRTVRRARQGA
jgi:hypothetical protein